MVRLMQELVRWNVIVTGVAIALTVAGAGLVGVGVAVELLGVVACGTFVVYGADRRSAYSPEDRERASPQAPIPAPILLAGVALLSVLAWRLSPGGRILVAGLGLASALYILPALPGRRRLKEVPFAKTLLVAAGWAVATTLLPAIESGSDIDLRIACLVGYRMLYLLPNLLLADWPDRREDRSAGIHTLANRCRPHRFARLGMAACLAAIAAMLLLQASPWVLPDWAFWEILSPCGFLWLLRRRLPTSRLFYTTVADGLVAWPGMAIAIFI